MTAYLLVIAIWAVLFGFWLWLGALFDWITNYQHPIHSSPVEGGRPRKRQRGKGSC